MPKDDITRYNVEALIQSRKIAMKTKLNTLFSSDPDLRERCLKVDVRRVDMMGTSLNLEFYPRVMLKTLSGVKSMQRPSASLMWHSRRIRGLDFAITHPVLQNGVPVGQVRGWHEHYWTDEDQDGNIRQPKPPLKNFDLQAILEWCAENWNIEGLGLQGGLPL